MFLQDVKQEIKIEWMQASERLVQKHKKSKQIVEVVI